MKIFFKQILPLLFGLLFYSCNEKKIEKENKVPQIEVASRVDMGKFQSQFYLGAHLCREPMPPMEELKRDMETLKKNGFNLVKLQEQWAINEPEEGKYDFSKYEELISYAKKLGMYVYLGITMEQAPAWLYEKYPDCRMVGRDGTPIVFEAQSPIPADGKPGPCFDNPNAKEEQRKFIRKLVEVLGKYDNVLVWNTWQEIGYWPDRIVGQPVCYCKYTMNAFREWLKEKYSSLDNLNRQWNTNYTKWEYISPSRNYKQKIGIPQNINWDYFMENVKISNTLKERAAAIREVDKLNRPVFAHLGDWNYGSGRDWHYARSQDFLGSSTYPASNWGELDDWDDENYNNGNKLNEYKAKLNEMWRMLALRFDFLRSCNVPGHPVWAAEFQGGPVSTGFHKGRVPSAADMRRWMLTAIGAGVNTISFWVTRAEIMAAETNGFSLLDSQGDSTERFNEAARVGKALIRHADIFGKPSWTGSRVAIFVNEENYEFCANLPLAVENLEFSTRGWHRLLWDAGIPVDFISASTLDETDLNKYNALIMPFPVSISDTILIKLARYVENGGNLISEAGLARFNENGYSNRGEISKFASQFFGVKQTGYTMVSEPDNGHRWSPQPRTWGEFLPPAMLIGKDDLNGQQTRANFYLQTFDCLDSKPCLWYGNKIAGTVKNYGKGKAWLFGTYIGHSGTAYRDNYTPEFVKSLMKKCGIEPEHEGKLLVRKRKVKGQEALFITNPTNQKITEQLDIGEWKIAYTLFDEPVEIADKKINITLESLDVAVVLLQ
ncbi:MAG: beta-galactosidase [Ginsengibacter sp.]